ncbi:MAG: MBL fold metallo-hydrolase [Sandaracinaceae bacterium]
MNIEAFYDARTFTLTYLVWHPTSRDAVVIDPVLDYDPGASRTFTESVDQVSARIREERLRLHAVLETHAHADHLSGAQILRRRHEADVVIGAAIAQVQEVFKSVFDFPVDFPTDGSQFDRQVSEGDVLEAGALRVEVLETPGHTPACVTYAIGDALFTGDALFMDDYGTGRCDFPRGSAADLFDSVQKLYRLPDATRVFVGHDYQPGGRELRYETTIGASKQNNPQLRADTDKATFVALRESRDATLDAPRLLMPSVQVNLNAGRLPAARDNGRQYLNIPLNPFHHADALGEPDA